MPNLKARPCEEATIRSVAPARDCAARSKTWVLTVTILASTMAYVDESVVNVAMPTIERELHASAAVVQWLVNAYMLSLAALLLIGGASGDQFGRRRVLLLGTGVFTAASVWCGLSGDVAQLIAARAVQGAGAALLILCSLAIIGATFDETERGRAIGTWAGVSAISAAFGPLLGGWIVDHVSWRWIFLINPFLAVPTIWIALIHVPESRDPQAGRSLDWRGATLAFAGLGSLVFGLIALPTTGWNDPTVLAALAAAVVLLIAFVWEEARSAAPMMPLALFSSAMFSGVNILTLLLYAALGGAFFFLPFALIQVHGYSATLAGSVFIPFTLIMAALSRWSGGLLDRFGGAHSVDRRAGDRGPRVHAAPAPRHGRLGLGQFRAADDRARSRHGGDGRAAHHIGDQRRADASGGCRVGHQQRGRVRREPARGRDPRRGRAGNL